MGCSVEMAENGQEAYGKAVKESFDMIFMDIQMPVMNGIDSCNKIKEQLSYNSPPIIALTARSSQGEKEAILNSGLDGFLPKPVNRCDLEEMINRYIG
ncbi:response regulator [Flavobacteriales bacterium]|nr:response regulator [Flavobacteriales bacterium]